MSEQKLIDDKNLHLRHRTRLRERYERHGAMGLEPHILLELFLFGSIPRADTNPVSHRLLERFGSLDGVFRAKYDDLIKVKGVGQATARYIVETSKKAMEIISEDLKEKPIVSFERAANFLIWRMREFEERVSTIFLDGMMRVINVYGMDDFEDLNILCKNILENSHGAKNVIIGINFDVEIDANKISSLNTLLKDKINLCDVIKINMYDAMSLI